MTPLRENRSTAAPANRETRILGIKKAINTRAVAWAESVSVTINQTRATRKMWSPTWERVCPVHKSEKFRLFQTRARRDIHNKKLFFVRHFYYRVVLISCQFQPPQADRRSRCKKASQRGYALRSLSEMFGGPSVPLLPLIRSPGGMGNVAKSDRLRPSIRSIVSLP